MNRAALALALVALAVAVGAWWDAPTAAPCACPTPDPEAAPRAAAPEAAPVAQIQRLHQRVAALEARLADPPPAVDAARASGGSPAPGPAPPIEALAVHRDPHPAVSVTLGEGDALSVRNADPALTGQVMFVELRGPDGHTVRRPITVPAPD